MALTSTPSVGQSELVDLTPTTATEPVADDLETPPFLGTRPKPRIVSILLRASVPVLLVATWWYGSHAGWFSTEVLSSPGDVWKALRELQQTGQLSSFVLASLQRMGIGVGVGMSAGLVLGTLSGLSNLGEELIDPTIQMFRAVPFLALTPLFISWFGVDELFKVVLIAVAAAFPMYLYTYMGVRNVDRKVVEAARGFGLKRRRLVGEVILPAALPSILMAIRVSLTVSLLGLIAAEQVGTTKGIGYLVTLAKQYFRTDYMVLCILMYAVLGLLADSVIRLLERVLMPWRKHLAIR